MAKEFKMFKDQYDVNIKALLYENNKVLTGIDYLIMFLMNIIGKGEFYYG